jgi:uncharacterized Zn finger protein
MKRKAIKIDWDELESAFDNKNEELVYYLDRVTGQVVLEGEGEDEFDDDDDLVDDSPAEAPPRDDTTRIYIEPLDPDELLSWMRDFLGDSKKSLESATRDRLLSAVEAREPQGAIREILDDNAEVRDRWFAYRSERLHETMDAWLDANDVSVVDPPPWK